jgi:hypothetical protein
MNYLNIYLYKIKYYKFITYYNLRLKIMSSPSVRKLSSSPIRHLDNNSPRKINKLQTILE